MKHHFMKCLLLFQDFLRDSGDVVVIVSSPVGTEPISLSIKRLSTIAADEFSHPSPFSLLLPF